MRTAFMASERFRKSLTVLLAGAAVGALLLGSDGGAEAQSLEEALAKAYRDNPTLQARRARLRAVDEGVPQALSGWRPEVQLFGTAGGQRTRQNITPERDTRTLYSLELEIRQNLYNGGSTDADVAAAEADVLAERARLGETEQNVLFQTVTAYMNVVRDQAVLDLNEQNERRLRRQLEATQDRFEVGEVTRTDVAQAESRLSRATSDKIRAAGNLEACDRERVRRPAARPRRRRQRQPLARSAGRRRDAQPVEPDGRVDGSDLPAGLPEQRDPRGQAARAGGARHDRGGAAHGDRRRHQRLGGLSHEPR
jgi:hypothetical protein